MTDTTRASNPTGAMLLDQSTAHPGSIDKSIFEKKTGPAAGSSVGQGTVNPNYLKECREDNPEPASAAASQDSVALTNCRFLTPVEELRCNEPFEMAVDAKVVGSANLGQIDFRLYSFLMKDGKEERSRVHTWQGFGKAEDPKAEPVVVKATGKLVYEVGTDLSKPIPFEIEAKHCQAKEPAKSPRVEVSNKYVAHWLGGDDLHFRTDGEFPLLGADGGLIQVLADAVRRIEKPVEKRETVICFGFASSVGGADHNRKLSLRRAQVVKAILDRDEKSWGDLAKANFQTEDIQQFLADLHAACGWECDPGAVDGQAGPKTKAAIESFQRECNARYDLGLKGDGVCGPRTWNAVLRAILGQVHAALGREESKAPSWPKANWGNADKGVYGNGEDFATGGDKPEERSVQITFFLMGAEQKLEDPKPGQKATTKDNPVQDEKLVEKKKIDKRNETEKAQPTKVAISNLRWGKAEAWEGEEAKLIAETTLKDGATVKVKLLVNGKDIFTGVGKISSGKLSFLWIVCECGLGIGGGIPEQVAVSATAEVNGKTFATTKDLTARFLVSSDWESFSQDYKWGIYSVHSEFRQRFCAHAIEVDVRSKVVKAWGGYLVKMTRAGITDKVDGCGFAGYRWGRVSGAGFLPNEYFDGKKWKKMPTGFVPQGGEYNAKAFVPLESNPIMDFFVGRKYGLQGNEDFVWPDTFADYSYDAPKYSEKRKAWIQDTKTRWSGKFKLRSKGCVGQHEASKGGHLVRLDFSMVRKEKYENHVIGLCPGNLRSNAGCFFYGETRIAMAAHEVGHLVGLPDEYVGGAVDPTINGDGAVAGIDATTLMGQSLGDVKKRHFVNFAEMAKRIAQKKTKMATEFVAS